MVTLQEKLKVVAEMEAEGCDTDTVEAMLECMEGQSSRYTELTPAIIEEIINENN